MSLKKALKRQQEFSARGSDCPICKHDFRSCPHSIAEAHERMTQNVFEARLDHARKRNR